MIFSHGTNHSNKVQVEQSDHNLWFYIMGLSLIEDLCSQMWPNGAGCSDQDQGHNGPHLDLQKIMQRRNLWILLHEHWRRKHIGLSMVSRKL